MQHEKTYYIKKNLWCRKFLEQKIKISTLRLVKIKNKK